jgi:hypothetical protein
MHVEILRGTTEKVQQPRKGKGEKEKRNDSTKKSDLEKAALIYHLIEYHPFLQRKKH